MDGGERGGEASLPEGMAQRDDYSPLSRNQSRPQV